MARYQLDLPVRRGRIQDEAPEDVVRRIRGGRTHHFGICRSRLGRAGRRPSRRSVLHRPGLTAGRKRHADPVPQQHAALGTGAPGVKSWQVMYKTSKIDGTAVATTGTVIVPTATWTGGGTRPIVSYALGTQGIGKQCAGSKQLVSGKEYEIANIVAALQARLRGRDHRLRRLHAQRQADLLGRRQRRPRSSRHRPRRG